MFIVFQVNNDFANAPQNYVVLRTLRVLFYLLPLTVRQMVQYYVKMAEDVSFLMLQSDTVQSV